MRFYNSSANQDDKENTIMLYINRPYYVLSGLTIDATFDYISDEERAQAVLELEAIIAERNLEPITGESKINKEDILYIPSTGEVESAELYHYYANLADSMSDNN